MSMKKLIFLLSPLFFLGFTSLFSQDVKIKKDVVYIDGNQCFTIVDDMVSASFFDESDTEVIYMQWIHNSTYGGGETYSKIFFPEQDLSFTHQSYVYTKKMLLKEMLRDRTMKGCEINPEKLIRFVERHDENIERDVPQININIQNN